MELVPGAATGSSATLVEPLSTAASEIHRLSIDHGRLVADGGRAALIWFSLVLLYGSQQPLTQGALLSLTVAAMVWLAALRSASLAQPACQSSWPHPHLAPASASGSSSRSRRRR